MALMSWMCAYLDTKEPQRGPDVEERQGTYPNAFGG
jgi:hypothetical protein